VILDSNLAVLYGVQTKVLNQAVKRNIKRFPKDFMFQLTNDEWTKLSLEKESLGSQNVTLKKRGDKPLRHFVTPPLKRGGLKQLKSKTHRNNHLALKEED